MFKFYSLELSALADRKEIRPRRVEDNQRRFLMTSQGKVKLNTANLLVSKSLDDFSKFLFREIRKHAQKKLSKVCKFFWRNRKVCAGKYIPVHYTYYYWTRSRVRTYTHNDIAITSASRHLHILGCFLFAKCGRLQIASG